MSTTDSWTTQQVEVLAPDAKTLQRGRALANPVKWVGLGADDHLLWGECQGSGAKRYQTIIDRSGPAYKCSCPSRQFPCKHSLGLFLLAADQPFPSGEIPVWASAWRATRETREKKAVPEDQVEKRLQQRLEKIEGGITDLETWMSDALRLGLAELSTKDEAYWEERTGRLVDAQAGGMASVLKNIREAFRKPAWQEEVLESLGQLHLIGQGMRHTDRLSEAQQTDFRIQAGIPIKKEALTNEEGLQDHWMVLGRYEEKQDRLRAQRTWLYGRKTGRFALLLEYAFGRNSFETNYFPGMLIHAELVYFPGSVSFRAIFRETYDFATADFRPKTEPTLSAFLTRYAKALGENPMLHQYPLVLSDVQPVKAGNQWKLRDAEGQEIKISKAFKNRWEILAVSGGRAGDLFGEWDGHEIFPMAMGTKNHWTGI